MEIREVHLSDVIPSEVNPRSDFGDVEELAKSFEFGPRPGEPVNPIIVVADGSRWRVIDGERRYRAMLELGTERCQAVVCDDLDEADELAVMMATDDKRRLDELERSRGTQRMLLLGVDPRVVDRAARTDNAAAVKRGIAALGPGGFERAETMSLEHLAAIAELEDAGDAEGAAAVAAAGEGEWRRVADDAAERRVYRESLDELRAACERAGVRLADERPEGMREVASGGLDRLLEAVDGLEGADGAVAFAEFYRWDPSKMWGYVLKDSAATEDAANAEADSRQDKLDAQGEALDEAMREWYFDTAFIANRRHVNAAALSHLIDRFGLSAEIDALRERRICLVQPQESVVGGTAAAALYLTAGRNHLFSWRTSVRIARDEPFDREDASMTRRWLGWLDAHVADGFEVPDGELAELADAARAALASHDEGADGE